MKRFNSLALLICVLGFVIFPSVRPTVAKADSNNNLSSGVAVNGTLASDTYQFTADNDGEVYIVLDQANAGFNLKLTDVDGNEITSQATSDDTKTAVIEQNIASGTYTVTVEPQDWTGVSSASYRLKATYPGLNTRNPVTFEPNDTYDTAYPVNSGQFYGSTIDSSTDRDVYKFTELSERESPLLQMWDESEVEQGMSTDISIVRFFKLRMRVLK
ncbi:hypothetical protein HPT25_26215 [Bacillus sp. BRMEA1]|uniref:hypothetical protein n=1 Tax=Neobacillus endophyticus TaxID=2738405 RepID=UPI001564E4D5|nr:hypothetical protein [Neobacillus endophyticus]NRD80826.1 hypothetical protein [Neobacillus endophyticus]